MMTTSPEKRILIYGDSIVYGRVPKILERFPANVRLTGVLQNILGNQYEVVEEGLRARMLKGINPNFEDRDGYTQFGPTLGSHLPLDLVILFLGTNDMNSRSNKSANDIAEDLDGYFGKINWWVKELQISSPPKILIVSPPLIDGSVLKEDTMFQGGEVKSKLLAALYEQKAVEHNANFFNAALHVRPSSKDGVHLDEENNSVLAHELSKVILQILG